MPTTFKSRCLPPRGPPSPPPWGGPHSGSRGEQHLSSVSGGSEVLDTAGSLLISHGLSSVLQSQGLASGCCTAQGLHGLEGPVPHRSSERAGGGRRFQPMGFSSPHFTPEGNTAELMLYHCIPLTLGREPGCWPPEVAETSSRDLTGKAFSITRALGCHSGLAGPCLGPGTRAGWCLVEGAPRWLARAWELARLWTLSVLTLGRPQAP